VTRAFEERSPEDPEEKKVQERGKPRPLKQAGTAQDSDVYQEKTKERREEARFGGEKRVP